MSINVFLLSAAVVLAPKNFKTFDMSLLDIPQLFEKAGEIKVFFYCLILFKLFIFILITIRRIHNIF